MSILTFVFPQSKNTTALPNYLLPKLSHPRNSSPFTSQTKSSTMSHVIVITGVSSGFGNMSAKALAKAGHIVYAGMRDPTPGNASVKDIKSFVEKEKVDMRRGP